MAGVSKRTIDYYTNLGLLKPVRPENNYRYYSEDTIIRLKIIENMKANRFTLKEIKEQFIVLDDKLFQAKKYNEGGMLNTDFLINQVKLLESQIVQLQPMLANLDTGQAVLTVRKKLFQCIALMQALLIYTN